MWFLFGILFASASSPEPLDRAAVIDRALADHPRLAARSDELAARVAAVDAAAPAPPLMTGVGLAPASLGMRPGVVASVAWELPLWRMRALRRELATAGVGDATASLEMARAELAARAWLAVDAAWLARERLTLLTHHRHSLEREAGVIASRVGAGVASPMARTMVAMSLAAADEEILLAEADLRDADAELRSVAGVPADAVAATAPPALPPDPVPTGTSPADRMSAADVAMRAAMADMADRAGRPMFRPMVSVSTMFDDPMHWGMIGLDAEIPLDTRAYRAGRDAARADVRAAAHDAEADARDRAADLARADGMVVAARAMLDLAETRMLPLAEERLDLARAAWASGRGSAEAWLEAERAALEAAFSALKARAELSRAQVMRRMIEGRPLTFGATP